MKKIRLILTVLIAFVTSVAYSQSISITGTVTDASTGEPIPFASVLVKGTRTGVSTDLNGKYTISAAPTAVLTFSSIGYTESDIPVSNRTSIDAVLSPSAIALEDVLVVAYGTVRREAKTGSVSTVKGEGIAEVPVTSVDKMLAGKMAGVQVTAASGQPGASSQIRVRGTSSINAGSEPLWVVDGIPVMNGDQTYFTNTGNAIASINPSDIESITVLKDAAAASVYGSRAANGVILVTTKSGKEGKARFNARAKYGISQLANDNNFGIMNGEQLLGYQRAAAMNRMDIESAANKSKYDPDNANGLYYRPMSLLDEPLTDWMDHFTRLGNLSEFEINASAGNQRGKFYTSLSYQENEGVFYGIDFSKLTARVNSDYKLTDKLEIGTRVNLAYTVANDVPMQSLYYSNPAFAGMTLLPWIPAYNEDGTHNINIPSNSNTNPRATAEYDDQWEKQYRMQGSFYLQWSPIKNITIKTTNAAEGTFGEGRRYWSPETDIDGATTLQSSTLQYMQLTTSNTITYNNVFNDQHNVRALVGQEAMRRTYNSYYIYSPNVDPAIPYPNTSTPAEDEGGYDYNARTLMSFFGIFDYSYESKYLLQGSVRYDGSSLFGSNKRWGLFWSAGGSWNIHNESWFKNIKMVDLLKLRLSYGVNGNDNISAYRAYGVYASTAYNGYTGMLPSTPSNQNLSWELNKSWNLGLDFGLFGKLNGSIDAYRRLTTDMLLSKNVPQTSGFSSNFLNIGELLNTGIEFQLEGTIIQNKELTWNAGLNIAYNKTELLNLGDNNEITYSGDSRLKHTVGKSMYTFYLKDYYGVNPSNGEALWNTADGTLTNDYNKGAWMYAGSPEPKFTGGFNTSLTWKGFNLSAFIEFKTGNKVLIVENRYVNADGNQMNMNQTINSLNYWKQPGDVGVNPKPIAGTASNSYTFASTRWLQDGSYARIKDITLSYSFPKKWMDSIKMSGLKLYVSAYNLYTFHDVDFWDPERGVTGMGTGIYPMTKTIVGGLELSF
ncbi:MAG: TonB-dependent receptor [Bacteroidales bacterium]|jgi:TonB-linked SusC/RagA family outer membrane protein|nr:TonB-dependent receptor [Bacteroidales bacterium]